MLDLLCFPFFLNLHPHFLPACRRLYRKYDESAFSRKILHNLVGTRQQEEMEGPFIFEKTTTIVTFECGLEKNEEGSHHLQWESLGLPSTLPALPFLQSALCISFRSFTKLGRRKGHSEVLRLCLALLAKQIHIKQTKKKRKKLKKEQLSVLTQSPNFVLCYVRPHVLDVISCQLYV